MAKSKIEARKRQAKRQTRKRPPCKRLENTSSTSSNIVSADEEWRSVVGYEGLYEVSDQGKVRSLDRSSAYAGVPNARQVKGRLRKPQLNAQGYYFTADMYDAEGIRKTRTIHSLVMEAFEGLRPAGLVIRHGPKGSFCDHFTNLCYGTQKDNLGKDRERDGTYGGKAVIRGDGVEFKSVSEAAQFSGCWRPNICKCCKGKLNRTGGYTWRYK